MPRRILEGEVVSDKMDKTITVLVTRRYMHPVYKKYLRKSDKFAAHDEKNQFKIGDRVQIEECRPISKKKKWTVITESQAAGSERRIRIAEETSVNPAKKEGKKQAATKAAAKAEDKAESKAAKKPAKSKKD